MIMWLKNLAFPISITNKNVNRTLKLAGD